MTGPYAQGASAYWQAGWRGILPLPPRQKGSPPKGYTGAAGIYPSYADVWTWTEGNEGGGNLGLRMPAHIIGIDVDAYGNKLGCETLALAEDRLGPLPPTWRNTSRDDGVSGIRLYRVPEGLSWPGELGPGIETVHRSHRYAVAWPSIHPEGGTYRWYGPDGIVTMRLPDPDDIVALPERWVEAYTHGELAVEVKRRDMAYAQAIAWLVSQFGALASPCIRMGRVADTIDAELRAGSAHAAGRDAALRIARYADEGHRGAAGVLAMVRASFLAETTSSQRAILGKDRRTAGDAEHEWQALVASAVGLVIENSTGMATCDCDGQLTAAILGTHGSVALAAIGQQAVAQLPVALPVVAPVVGAADEAPTRMVDGAAFILDSPEGVPAIWGDGEDVFWAEGEALMIAGPPGVGKTTLTGQVVRGLLGLQSTVLGLTVRPTTGRVLYLAMDRPAQIARGLRRAFTEAERYVLADRLRVWRGPPPGDVAKHPDVLVTLAQMAEADVIILDSLKDAAIGLTEDESAAMYNRARQSALARGIQVLELHHMVKRGAGGNKPTELADVYGSAWLTAGAGSVLLLWGAAGDPVVELKHLKQPASEVGPWMVEHDHDNGTSEVMQGDSDLITIVARSGLAGITPTDVAVVLYGSDSPPEKDKVKARRKLKRLVAQGHVEELTEPRDVWGGGKPQHRYRSAENQRHPNDATSFESQPTIQQTPTTPNDVSAGQPNKHPTTPNNGLGPTTRTPPSKGGALSDPVDLVACSTCFRPVGTATAKACGGLCPTCHAKAGR